MCTAISHQICARDVWGFRSCLLIRTPEPKPWTKALKLKQMRLSVMEQFFEKKIGNNEYYSFKEKYCNIWGIDLFDWGLNEWNFFDKKVSKIVKKKQKVFIEEKNEESDFDVDEEYCIDDEFN